MMGNNSRTKNSLSLSLHYLAKLYLTHPLILMLAITHRVTHTQIELHTTSRTPIIKIPIQKFIKCKYCFATQKMPVQIPKRELNLVTAKYYYQQGMAQFFNNCRHGMMLTSRLSYHCMHDHKHKKGERCIAEWRK